MQEKPPSPCALQGADRMALLAVILFPLCSSAERRGMRGPLSSHLGLIAACLTLKRLFGGCSPRGLGGMSYPFKGLNQASGPPGEDEGSCRVVAVTLRVVVHGKVGDSCLIRYLFTRFHCHVGV
jgi:hypothetical protein